MKKKRKRKRIKPMILRDLIKLGKSGKAIDKPKDNEEDVGSRVPDNFMRVNIDYNGC